MATAMNATSTFSCPHNGTAHDGTLLCHWSNSPGARGTLNIFWLCISTLALCLWNAVPPDVPPPNAPWLRVFGKRVCMLLVGLFMPEMLVLVAMSQFRQAWQLLVDIDNDASCFTEYPWWTYPLKSWRPKRGKLDSPAKRWLKTLLRWMVTRLRSLRVPSLPKSDVEKGRCVSAGEKDPSPPAASGADDAPADDSSNSSDPSPQAHNDPRPAPSDLGALSILREHPWTLTHSFYAVMNGFVDERGHTVFSSFEANKYDEGWSKSLLQRLKLPPGDPERIPDVSMDDIEDRNKAGIVAKSLLFWQLFVFLADCFARWNQSLPLSLLEITTIGHSLCSIIAMVLWWYKPHSIGETVIARRGPLPSLANVEWRKILSWSFLADLSSHGLSRVFGDDPSNMDVPRIVTIVATAALYGLPHLLGLSVHFPTFAERLCWEVATFTVIGSPLVMCVILWIAYTRKLGRMKGVVNTLLVLFAILLVLYPIASMFLVGESVRQIFALPVESFREPQLTTYLPSFS